MEECIALLTLWYYDQRKDKYFMYTVLQDIHRYSSRVGKMSPRARPRRPGIIEPAYAPAVTRQDVGRAASRRSRSSSISAGSS